MVIIIGVVEGGLEPGIMDILEAMEVLEVEVAGRALVARKVPVVVVVSIREEMEIHHKIHLGVLEVRTQVAVGVVQQQVAVRRVVQVVQVLQLFPFYLPFRLSPKLRYIM